MTLNTPSIKLQDFIEEPKNYKARFVVIESCSIPLQYHS